MNKTKIIEAAHKVVEKIKTMSDQEFLQLLEESDGSLSYTLCTDKSVLKHNDINWAFQTINENELVTRQSWDKGTYIYKHKVYDNIMIHYPYTKAREDVLWGDQPMNKIQADILATDWILIP